MILLEPRSDHLPSASTIVVKVFLFVLFGLLLFGMIFCWKNPHVRRWLGDCAPWRRKQRGEDVVNKGLGIEGAGDLEGGNSRTVTADPEGDLRSELHTPTYSDLVREKELRRGDTSSFSSRVDVTPTVPEPVASIGSPRLAVSRALRYVTKDAQQHLFPSLSKPGKDTPTLPPAPSPRKYSFRSARAARKGAKLTISPPIYGDLPALTLSLPAMTLSWANYEPTITGSESSEPSPTSTLPFTDCAETLNDDEDVLTVDYETFTSRSNFDEFRAGGKRLSVHSQMSGISIISGDTGKVSFAQVAMRPESRPTLQIIGPCESPKRVVVVHY